MCDNERKFFNRLYKITKFVKLDNGLLKENQWGRVKPAQKDITPQSVLRIDGNIKEDKYEEDG